MFTNTPDLLFQSAIKISILTLYFHIFKIELDLII